MNRIALLLLLFTFTLSLPHCRLELEELDFIVVRTEAPAPLNAITLTVRGEVEGLVNGRLRDHGHVWSPSLEQLSVQAGDTISLGPRSGNGEFLSTIDVDRLASNTEYFFRAYALPEEGAPVYSDEITSIRTGSVMVTTGEEVSVNIVTFVLPGAIDDLILGQVREHGHLWWTESLSNPAPTLADSAALAGFTRLGQRISNGSFFSIADSLAPQTTYFFRAYALIDTLFYGGETGSFQTGTIQVTTDRLLLNDAREAEAIGTISNLSLLNTLGYTVSEYGHVWTTDGSVPSFENNNYLDRTTFSDLEQDILFSSDLGPVVNAVPYQVRSYAVLDGRVVESDDVLQETFTTGFWTQVAALPPGRPARQGAVAFTLRHSGNRFLGFLCTGSSGQTPFHDLVRFTPEDDTNDSKWEERANFPGLARSEAVAFVIGTDAFVGSGWNGAQVLRDFWRYDPPENPNAPDGPDDWSNDVDSLPVARRGAVAFAIGNRGYVGLGDNETGLLTDFYRYNPEAAAGNQWTLLTGVHEFPGPPRTGAVAFVINGTAYCGLGQDSQGNLLTDLYQYNPSSASGGWTPLNTFPAPFSSGGRRDAVAFSLDNGKGYVVWGDGPNGPSNELWEYTPLSDSWQLVTTFPFGGRTGAAGFGIGNQGYIGTGDAGDGPTRDFWRFERGN